MSQQVLISAQDLKKYFPVKGFLGGKTKYLKAVDGVTLDIMKGETFGLVGESGCGKSTLGRTLIRMYDVTGGKLSYQGKDITNAKPSEMKEFRNKMQIIFQDPYSALNPFWNVEEILSEPLAQIGMGAGERKERIEYLLNKVGMKPDDMLKFPYEFSGGQRQRIGIARALSVNPEFVMCDEPIATLDVSIQAQVVNMLEDLQHEMGLTYLFAAHDLSMVRYISTRIGVMYLGNLVEVAKSDNLYDRPLHPYTQALLGAQFSIHMDPSQKIQSIESEAPSPLDVPKGCPFQNRCEHCTDRCKAEMPKLKEIAPGHAVACFYVEEQKI